MWVPITDGGRLRCVDAVNTTCCIRRSFRVVSRSQIQYFHSSRRIMRLVRFPAAPPEGPQIRLVSRSRTCRRRFQARASLRYIRSWRYRCRGDNPSRTCDAAKVSARAAKRLEPRRIPALSGRTSAHRATPTRSGRDAFRAGSRPPSIHRRSPEGKTRVRVACSSAQQLMR